MDDNEIDALLGPTEEDRLLEEAFFAIFQDEKKGIREALALTTNGIQLGRATYIAYLLGRVLDARVLLFKHKASGLSLVVHAAQDKDAITLTLALRNISPEALEDLFGIQALTPEIARLSREIDERAAAGDYGFLIQPGTQPTAA